MKIQRWNALLLGLLMLLTCLASAEDKKDEKKKDDSDVCMQANPVNLCNAGNTCGSASAPCSVDVKRTSYSATATPGIPGAKGNSLFCVKSGTTVTWMSKSKNTGFLIDFGSSSPFDPPGAITGGEAKPVSVVAGKQGCYKYNVSASYTSGIYGMTKTAQANMIVLGK